METHMYLARVDLRKPGENSGDVMQITKQLLMRVGGGFAAFVATGAAIGFAYEAVKQHQHNKEFNALDEKDQEAINEAVKQKQLSRLAGYRAGSRIDQVNHIEIEPPTLPDDDDDAHHKPMSIEGLISSLCKNETLSKADRNMALQMGAAYEVEDYEGALHFATQLCDAGVLMAKPLEFKLKELVT